MHPPRTRPCGDHVVTMRVTRVQVKDKLIFEQKKMAAVEQRKRETEQRQYVVSHLCLLQRR